MRNLLIAAMVTIPLAAQAQEITLRTSLRDLQPRVEFGKVIFSIEDNLNIWSTAGSYTDNGRLVGSFALLYKWKLTKNLTVDLGPELRFVTGQKPVGDIIFQVSKRF